jgi:HlyD family secretion protein
MVTYSTESSEAWQKPTPRPVEEMVTSKNPESTTQTTSLPAHPPKGKKALIVVVVLVAIGALTAFMYPRLPGPWQKPTDWLDVSGRIEGYETNVGPKIGGRVDVINHREGELVKRGELLVQISDDDIQAQLRGAEARISKAKEQVEEGRYKIEGIQTQIESSRIKVDQSKENSAGLVRQWQSTLATDQARESEAEAQLEQAKADFRLAKIRRDRYAFLVSKLAVTKDEYDQAQATYDTSTAVVKSKEASLEAAKRVLKADQGQVRQAEASRLNPPMDTQEMMGYQKQLLQAQHELKSAQHEVDNAIADKDQTKANIAYLKINSPIDAVVTARAVEPGAVVVPGTTLLSLIDLNNLYLRAYVPEGQIDKVHVGQSAEILLDGRQDKPLNGKVIQVDPQGSFTPENIYFKDDRVKQVFGIKIAVLQDQWYAKPGMPADAKLSLK